MLRLFFLLLPIFRCHISRAILNMGHNKVIRTVTELPELYFFLNNLTCNVFRKRCWEDMRKPISLIFFSFGGILGVVHPIYCAFTPQFHQSKLFLLLRKLLGASFLGRSGPNPTLSRRTLRDSHQSDSGEAKSGSEEALTPIARFYPL